MLLADPYCKQYKTVKLSEYDQEILKSHTADTKEDLQSTQSQQTWKTSRKRLTKYPLYTTLRAGSLCSDLRDNVKWASSRENLSSGFPTKRVSKQSPLLQRLARKLKFDL